MKNLAAGVESVYEREQEQERGKKRFEEEKGRCPAPSRTRTLSFHTDRDCPRLHFRVQATPALMPIYIYTYIYMHIYILAMRNEKCVDPRFVYMKWIKVRQLGEATASYCYIQPNISDSRYRRQFLALCNYARVMGSTIKVFMLVFVTY